MAVFGPVSSLFDFTTFYVMIVILNAGTTSPHRLVRRVARDPDPGGLRDPHPLRAVHAEPTGPGDDRLAIACAAVGASLRFFPTAQVLGSRPLQLELQILIAIIVGYLLLA